MRHVTILSMLILLALSSQTTAKEPAPYLYYCSAAENAFVIERADGTDRRLFAQDVTPERAKENHFRGPGWSPDGQWFTWITTYYADRLIYRSAHVFSTDDQKALNIFSHIENIFEMYWSPDSQYLPLNVNPNCQSAPLNCHVNTYWLVRVADNALLAIFDIGQQPSKTGVEWATEDAAVHIYLWEEGWGQSPLIGHHRITMHTDGRGEKQPITREEYEAHITPDDYWETGMSKEFPAPNGDYRILLFSGRSSFVQDDLQDELFPLPRFDFNSRNSMHPVKVYPPHNKFYEDFHSICNLDDVYRL